MILIKADIDKLLAATEEMAEEDDFRYIIRRVEIDKLLEKTQDW